jgi:peroxiredoxin
MKRLALTVLLAALVPATAMAFPRAGQPAAPFTLQSASGKTVSMSQFKGKAVYLNFFATWCPPCNDEAPAIGKLAKKYAGKVTILGVNELENPSKAKSFMEKYHLPYTALVDSDGSLGHAYGMIGLPVHVFIDKQGNVKQFVDGEMSAEEIDAALKSIQ